MEFKDVLAKRRMVRNYRNDPVEPEVLERIAMTAFKAPSAGFSQGIACVIVTRPELRQSIAILAGEDEYVRSGFDPWISGAPAHLVIAVSEDLYHARYSEPDKTDPDGKEIEWPIPYWWVDAGASLMAVLLAAVDEGLAAGFLGVHSVPQLAETLGLPERYTPIGVVTIGYPAPDRRSSSLKRGRRPNNSVLKWEQWKG